MKSYLIKKETYKGIIDAAKQRTGEITKPINLLAVPFELRKNKEQIYYFKIYDFEITGKIIIQDNRSSIIILQEGTITHLTWNRGQQILKNYKAQLSLRRQVDFYKDKSFNEEAKISVAEDPILRFYLNKITYFSPILNIISYGDKEAIEIIKTQAFFSISDILKPHIDLTLLSEGYSTTNKSYKLKDKIFEA